MKRAIAVIALASLVLGSLAALDLSGNGELRTESRSVTGFSSIDMRGSGILRVSRGPSFRLSVTLDANLLPYYASTTRGGVLYLGFEGLSSVHNYSKLNVDLVLPELSALRLSGACEAVLGDGFTGSTLALELSGAGRVTGRIDYRGLSLVCTGSGLVRLTGRAESLDLSLTGASEFDGSRLASNRVKATGTGACRLKVRAAERLDASVQGASSLVYYGSPALQIKTSGSSTVRRG
jgi:hypothetical protein